MQMYENSKETLLSFTKHSDFFLQILKAHFR